MAFNKTLAANKRMDADLEKILIEGKDGKGITITASILKILDTPN